MAIEGARLEPIVPMEQLEVHCLYDDVSRITDLLSEVGATHEVSYADAVTFTVSVPTHLQQFLTEQVIERTSARAGFSKIST